MMETAVKFTTKYLKQLFLNNYNTHGYGIYKYEGYCFLNMYFNVVKRFLLSHTLTQCCGK